jgi:uncharacterized membrane protein
MNRRIFQFATLVLWLALPLVALQYRQVWDQLPVHVATHFNAAGQANGWMSRQEATQFGVGFVGFLLVIFTVLVLYTARARVDGLSWALLGFFALVVAFMVEVNRSIVNYNLHGSPIEMGGMLIALPIAGVLLLVVYIAARREPALPSSSDAGDLLAEETHSGRAWGFVILIAMVGPVIALTMAHSAVGPLLVTVLGVVALVPFAMAWSGFQYRFRRHGVEIRMLGFRLRSIPKSAIVSYSIEPWAFIRGYGIRGTGKARAYVWCNKVVHIKTSNGDVFLGHDHPEKIVRDLDMVMGILVPG